MVSLIRYVRYFHYPMVLRSSLSVYPQIIEKILDTLLVFTQGRV